MTQVAEVDVAILTALRLERDAMSRFVDDIEEISLNGQTHHLGRIRGARVLVFCQHAMGNVRSAVAATQIIHDHRPRMLILAGITGGTNRATSEISTTLTAKEHLLGDVLVGVQVVDYELGKLKPREAIPRPRVYPASPRLLRSARDINLTDWIGAIAQPRPDGTTGRVNPQVHFGTIGSGQKVIQDPAFVDSLKAVWSELVGVEMEGFGAALAAFESDPPVDFMVIKGICDWADPDKNDDWQPYAADASAAFVAAVIRRACREKPPTSERSKRAQSPAERKLEFCRRLGDSWKDLCDAIEIPVHERRRFERGDEAREIWEWMDLRGKLGELPDALLKIHRLDLADLVQENP
jgi:nucleoside phosphorylase